MHGSEFVRGRRQGWPRHWDRFDSARVGICERPATGLAAALAHPSTIHTSTTTHLEGAERLRCVFLQE